VLLIYEEAQWHEYIYDLSSDLFSKTSDLEIDESFLRSTLGVELEKEQMLVFNEKMYKLILRAHSLAAPSTLFQLSSFHTPTFLFVSNISPLTSFIQMLLPPFETKGYIFSIQLMNLFR
jgi:hypothetical protein